jgi:hypothetical protein
MTGWVCAPTVSYLDPKPAPDGLTGLGRFAATSPIGGGQGQGQELKSKAKGQNQDLDFDFDFDLDFDLDLYRPLGGGRC